MSTVPISVLIPVGAQPHHRQWLDEAIDSVAGQLAGGDELVLLNDGGAPLGYRETFRFPHPCGLVAAFNCGVALARNEQVVMMGADDRLLPGALDAARVTYARYRDPLGYYFYAVRYNDGREQNVPCHAAMITKPLWKATGGFPQEAALGACDHIFLQMLITGRQRGVWHGGIYNISPNPLYWYRAHADSETNNRTQRWWGLIQILRDDLATKWTPLEAVAA
jgi:glycosyltransferase involved in cell wall biosynthesis